MESLGLREIEVGQMMEQKNDLERYVPTRSLWPAFTLSSKFRRPFNVCEEFLDQRIAQGQGNNIAIISGDQRISYSELLREVQSRSSFFSELGVKNRQRVICQATENTSFAISFLSLLRLGAIPVPAYKSTTAYELSKISKLARAGLMMVSDSNAAQLQEVSRAGGVVVLSESSLRNRASGGDVEPVRLNPDEACLVLFTSGSSGNPKGCIHLARDLLLTTEFFGRGILSGTERDIFAGTPSLAFSWGSARFLSGPLDWEQLLC